MQALVPAQLLPGLQPHRGGLLEDQGDRTQSLRQDSRGPARGAGRSIVRGQLPGCLGVLRARRLPSYGSTTMKRAVTVVCWSWICRLGSIEIGVLGPINALSFDYRSGSPESQLALLPDINKPPVICSSSRCN